MEIALSSIESEYTGLSYVLCKAIPIMILLKEFWSQGINLNACTPQIKYKVFEDNSGALEIASIHKYRFRTKHSNIKLHHFYNYVTREDIKIKAIDTTNQLADYLTKLVNHNMLTYLHKKVIG